MHGSYTWGKPVFIHCREDQLTQEECSPEEEEPRETMHKDQLSFTAFIFAREPCMETTGRGRDQIPKVRANLKQKVLLCLSIVSFLKNAFLPIFGFIMKDSLHIKIQGC